MCGQPDLTYSFPVSCISLPCVSFLYLDNPISSYLLRNGSLKKLGASCCQSSQVSAAYAHTYPNKHLLRSLTLTTYQGSPPKCTHNVYSISPSHWLLDVSLCLSVNLTNSPTHSSSSPLSKPPKAFSRSHYPMPFHISTSPSILPSLCSRLPHSYPQCSREAGKP